MFVIHFTSLLHITFYSFILLFKGSLHFSPLIHEKDSIY
uniref:Uncharacterized protein n=1 Tax=Rhizophora mucronata TaxID=61149 RepID=A0A2P2QV92_RHIMU